MSTEKRSSKLYRVSARTRNCDASRDDAGMIEETQICIMLQSSESRWYSMCLSVERQLRTSDLPAEPNTSTRGKHPPVCAVLWGLGIECNHEQSFTSEDSHLEGSVTAIGREDAHCKTSLHAMRNQWLPASGRAIAYCTSTTTYLGRR